VQQAYSWIQPFAKIHIPYFYKAIKIIAKKWNFAICAKKKG